MEGNIDGWGVAWRIVATLVLVGLNAFFVAAEFALIKVRPARLEGLAREGNSTAKLAHRMALRMAHYLSACQLGITMASLGLGALGEPAVARLLNVAAAGVGIDISIENTTLRVVSFMIAFLIITMLHMTVGEQAPKIWALHHAERTALRTARTLWVFERLLLPMIWMINGLSNAFLRLQGLRDPEIKEGSVTAEELRAILATSASAGHISSRQREIAENVLRMVELEVRHIQVPAVDVVYLSLQNPVDDNLALVESAYHSRLPVCEAGLDSLIGFVHAKDLLQTLRAGAQVDLRALARPPLHVPETQPLARFLRELQDKHSHVAAVVDERGTLTGLAFLEDAIEEIVGPIQDEFDTEAPPLVELETGIYEVRGRMPLPEAVDRLGLNVPGADEDTIGGLVVAMLGRFPRPGDQVELGPYRVTVSQVTRRRPERLRFEHADARPQATE